MAEEVKELQQKLNALEQRLHYYEADGPTVLYYSLNRKMVEMANLMNSVNLKDIEIDDPKSKKFDRLKTIWQDASSIAAAVRTMGEIAGITGDEDKDVKNSRRRTTPESIAEDTGENKRQDV